MRYILCMENSVKQPRFTSAALKKLILPLMLEQFLLVLVGLADSVMVASCGEASVSGVSLVDSVNILLIQVFAALATGGAVVASQYLGRKDNDNASRAAKQLLWISVLIALVVSAVAVLGDSVILRFVFGNVDAEVMEAASTYFWISALSYPFLALYNAGAALFRSMGNSRVSLWVSMLLNVINIIFNSLFIFGLHWGVAGAALASLLGRAAAGIIMVVLLHSPRNSICLTKVYKPEFKATMLQSILKIGVPNGLENGMFQVGKLLVASLIATFGTAAIAANAICNSIGSLSNVPGSALGLAILPVVGQCVGAGDYEDARYYTRKIMKISFTLLGVVAVALFFATPALVGIYQVSAEASSLAVITLQVFFICNIFFWPQSFVLPNALRGAGDAKFTMTVSILSMWIFRIGCSYLLGSYFGMGLLGVWIAMVIDWVVRGICFVVRFRGSKWNKKAVID